MLCPQGLPQSPMQTYEVIACGPAPPVASNGSRYQP